MTDVLLHGECKPQATPSERFAMMTSAAGARVLGIQTAQLAAVMEWSCGHMGVQSISLAGVGPVSSVLTLCAASLSDTSIDHITLTDSLASLKQLTEEIMRYDDYPSLFCFGLLQSFDIRELLALLAPVPIKVNQPHADHHRLIEEWSPLTELYDRLGSVDFKPWQV